MTDVHRDPYGLALKALKQFATGGRFGWGQPLVVKDLAAELGLSPTPVREALACLSGQGLVLRLRGRGYFFPALTASDIIDLYDLQWSFVQSAVTAHARGRTTLHKTAARFEGEADFPALFTALITHSGNDALALAYQHLTERLAPVSRAERQLDVVYKPTALELASAMEAGDADSLLTLIAAHHRHRCGLAAETARLLRRMEPTKV